MRLFIGFINIISIPIMFLNLVGSIVAGIWLAVLGEWPAIGIGILGFIFSSQILSFAMIPAMLLGAPGVYCAEIGNKLGFVIFSTLYSLYTMALITVWCCGILFFFIADANSISLIPLLIWSYGVSTGPWSYMAGKEEQASFGISSSSLIAFLVEVAYLLLMFLVILTSLNQRNLVIIFASFMFIGLLFNILLMLQYESDI